MSRMAPFPRAVSNGVLTVRVPSGSLSRDVLLQPAPAVDGASRLPTHRLAALQSSSTNAAALPDGWSPETWTLAIARQPVPAPVVLSGAVVLAPSAGEVSLEKGMAILASTRVERPGQKL
jgi:hypothetical protein